MGMDMYIEKIKRNPNNKQEIVEREELCYWRKFWDLHEYLDLYSDDDYNVDVPMTKDDVERCLYFVTHNSDYFCSFNTVTRVCELLEQYDLLKQEGWEIVYNANW